MIYFTYQLVNGSQPFPLGEAGESRVLNRYQQTDGKLVGQCTAARLTDVFADDVIQSYQITQIDVSLFTPPITI
jgi:hypothetical protein